ncbi:hypothetical protein NS14008_31160 [Nocardia seriolae]|nr:hypothetical protein NS14008_31160 [Nocardia seriolae]
MAAAAAVAGAAVLAACGSNTTDAAGSAASATTMSAGTTTTAPTSTSAAPGSAVGTVEMRDLGGRRVLADGAGRALYLFTKDTPGVSTCTGECLVKWPAVPGGVSAGAGVDPAKLGTLTRADGAVQASYAGKPLYYFAGDKNPGDTAGQGVMDVWFLLDAQGEAIR